MNKPLGTGILFILSIIMLYFGGTSKGAIGAGLAVGGLVCFVAAAISGIKSFAIRSKKPNKATRTSDSDASVEPKPYGKDKYTRLEKKRGWRAAKVAYWLLIAFVIIFSLFHVDYYENSDMQGFALLVMLVCLPLYLLYRKVAFYIVSGE